MDLGWSAATQAVVIAISTIIVRVYAKRDKEALERVTASHTDIQMIRSELRDLRSEFNLLRHLFFKVRPDLQHIESQSQEDREDDGKAI